MLKLKVKLRGRAEVDEKITYGDMARLLNSDGKDDLTARFGAQALAVSGTVYTNTAAKFWSGLMDELGHDFPDCTEVAFTAPGPGLLSRELLFPADALQREFDGLAKLDLEEVIRQTVAELELLGPPSGVRITLFSDGRELESRELPLECVDADVFAYLLVWLLEWSAIPEGDWNSEFLSGDIAAADFLRRLRYRMDFELRNEHLSEGLYRRSLTLQFSRKRRSQSL